MLTKQAVIWILEAPEFLAFLLPRTVSGNIRGDELCFNALVSLSINAHFHRLGEKH